MKHTILKFGSFGLITGFIIFMLHLTLGINNLDYSTNEILGYVSILLSLSFIFFGLKYYRDKVNNGVLSFGKALTIGVLISLFVGLGIAIADFIYTKLIDPDFFSRYEEMMKNNGNAEEMMEMTSASAAVFMLILVSVIGFIISLISGLILQRKEI